MTPTSFPHLCAHRGLSQACPENTLPALGAAVALRVHEMEIDLWSSRDGVPVICHDRNIDRTTDARGMIPDLTWAEIRRADAGVRLGEAWRGVRVPRFEELLEMPLGETVLNLHVKEAGPDGKLVRRICELLRLYGRADRAYIAGCTEAVLQVARDCAPDVERAAIVGAEVPQRLIDNGLRYGCRRVQFGRNVTEADLRRAGEVGLVRNLFWSDDPDDAREWQRRGVDVFLTNAAHRLIAGGFLPRPGARSRVDG